MPKPESMCHKERACVIPRGSCVPQPRPDQHSQVNEYNIISKNKELDFFGKIIPFFFAFIMSSFGNHIDTRWYNSLLCLVSPVKEIFTCPHYVGTQFLSGGQEDQGSDSWNPRTWGTHLKASNMGIRSDYKVPKLFISSSSFSNFLRKSTAGILTLPQRDPLSNTFLLKKSLTL